jgi:hypothetical protein
MITRFVKLIVTHIYLCSPLNPPEGDLKDICFNNYVKMNEFCDIVLKSPSGGFRGLCGMINILNFTQCIEQ